MNHKEIIRKSQGNHKEIIKKLRIINRNPLENYEQLHFTFFYIQSNIILRLQRIFLNAVQYFSSTIKFSRISRTFHPMHHQDLCSSKIQWEAFNEELQLVFPIFFPQLITRLSSPPQTMGVSISRSSAHTELRKKSKNREASKSKDLFQKNVKSGMEGRQVDKQNGQYNKNLLLIKALQAKHPSQEAALSSQKSIEMQMSIQKNQNLNNDEQLTGHTASRRVLGSLKKSLHLPCKQTNQHELNSDPAEQFTKAQTSNKKNSTPPSYFSIHTNKETEIPVSVLTLRNATSGKSINRGRGGYASNPGSSLRIDEEFLSGEEWKSVEEDVERSKDGLKSVGFKSIVLSNKFAQMSSHMHECENCETINDRKQVIPTKIVMGSRRTRPI